jgi:hypothetical protein
VDLVAEKVFAEASSGVPTTKTSVYPPFGARVHYHHTGTAPAVTLLLLLRVGVVTEREKWLERIRQTWSEELRREPRVWREANYMDVTL